MLPSRKHFLGDRYHLKVIFVGRFLRTYLSMESYIKKIATLPFLNNSDNSNCYLISSICPSKNNNHELFTEYLYYGQSDRMDVPGGVKYLQMYT